MSGPPAQLVAICRALPEVTTTGVWLDVGEVGWDRVEQLLLDSYRLTAPKRLAAQAGVLSGQAAEADTA